MLKYHKEKEADATIAVIDVTNEEAKRFGIMNTNADGRIIEFEEKPKKPKSTLASMGVYIFNYKTLKRFLIDDEADEKSAHDFGKNIIPAMLTSFQKLYTYRFEGYWRDIGTIESIWDTNMDLIRPDNDLDLFSDSWKIYTKSSDLPPQYVGPTAKICNSLISEGCQIYGTVENSIIFPGVTILENSLVKDSIIMSDTVIESDVAIRKAILCNHVLVHGKNEIGDGETIEVVEEDSEIASDSYAKAVG